MISALIRFSVRHPVLVAALALALMAWGVNRLFSASLDVFPEFSPTQVVIQTESPGLSAAWVEALVSQPLEQAIAGLDGLQALKSQSMPGLSVVTVFFTDGGDIHRHRQAVAERLAQAASRLPPGIVPNLTPLTSSASTVLAVGVTSKTLDGTALRGVVERTLRPTLLAAQGVADVNVFGGQEPQWQIRIDPQRLARHGLTIAELEAAARQATGMRAAGFVEGANQRIALGLEPGGDSAEALAQAVVRPAAGAQGAPLLLRDVADLVPGGAPAISGVLIDGVPGVFLMVQGQLGANTRDATVALDAALDRVEPALERQGATLHRDLFRPAGFIETAVGNVQRDVLVGAALVIAVLFAFLYNVRTALVTIVAIPLSLLAAVLVLQAFGVGLNIMVLGGLAIALGEVVDDAIIDCENIYRRLRENRALPQPKPAAQVVYDASVEVRASVVYATFVVALVFVPLLTLSGVAGKLFAPLGWAYISAILASLAVALTVTPALSLLLLANSDLPAGDPPFIAWLKPRYRALLLWVEDRSTAVITTVALGMALGIGMLPLFRGEFIPPLKEGHYIVHMAAVAGTSLNESLRLGEKVSQELLAIEGVKSVAQWVGRAENGADTFGPHYSEIEVELGQIPGAEQRRILAEIRRRLGGDGGESPGFAGLQFGVNTFLTERIGETVSGVPAEVVVNLYGEQLDTLDADARAVAGLLLATPGARDVQVLAPPGAPELSIRLRPEKLARHGLAAAEVMDAVQAAFGGVEVGQVWRDGLATPLVLVLPPALREDPGQVGALPLGWNLTLADVADLDLVQGRSKILRDGARRVQVVTANLQRGHDPEAFVARLERQLRADVKLSPGVHAEVIGAARAQATARAELLQVALMSAVGVAALLLLAFRSARHLAIVFVNLPFALVGGVAAVLATGGVLSIGTMVGFVTLFGITLRNSIMMVSHYQHLVENEGRDWGLATAVQGALERLPSILMTALVTGLALAPLALGSAEPGREIEGPMATIIVGGLVSSTLLNLLVLPTVLLRFGRFAPRPAMLA